VIVFYCACPEDASSAHATLILRRLGFESVWALKGDLAAWYTTSHDHEEAMLVPITLTS